MATYENLWIGLGYAGSDPETHTFEDGNLVTNLSLATTRSWKKKGSDEWSEETTWHRLVFYGRDAVNAADWLRKGSRVFVEGYIRSRKVEDKYYTDIVVQRWINVSPRDGDAPKPHSVPSDAPQASSLSSQPPLSDPDDDLPF